MNQEFTAQLMGVALNAGGPHTASQEVVEGVTTLPSLERYCD